MKFLNAIYTVWLREMIKFFREKPRIIGNVATPFFWLAIMGVGLGATFNVPNATYNYLSFVAPGIIAMSLLFTSIFSGISIIFDKQFGFMKEILVAPISRVSIVLGKLFGSTTTSLITGLIVFIVAAIMGGVVVQNITILNVLLIIIIMMLICFSFISIGIAIASKLESMEGFQVIMSFLVMPMFLLSGAFFPLENVPTWLRIISHIDPLMYGVDALRGVMLGTSIWPVYLNILVLIGFSAVFISLATWLFNRMGQ